MPRNILRRCLWMQLFASWLFVIMTLPSILHTAQLLHCIDGSTPSILIQQVLHLPSSSWPEDLSPTSIFLCLFSHGLPIIPHSWFLFRHGFQVERPCILSVSPTPPPLQDPAHTCCLYQDRTDSEPLWQILTFCVPWFISLLASRHSLVNILHGRDQRMSVGLQMIGKCYGLNNCPPKSHVLMVWCPSLWHYWDTGGHLRQRLTGGPSIPGHVSLKGIMRP